MTLQPAASPPLLGKSWIYHPLLHVALAVLLSATAQVFMKIGADAATVGDHSVWTWLGLEELASIWTWVGIAAYVTSFGSWLHALRFLPLGLAFNLTNMVHILVPISSWLFLHEQIGWLRGAGITLILLGIVLLAHDVIKVEEKV